jgi:hypothetical protein
MSDEVYERFKQTLEAANCDSMSDYLGICRSNYKKEKAKKKPGKHLHHWQRMKLSKDKAKK